jgi:hypothetical protein
MTRIESLVRALRAALHRVMVLTLFLNRKLANNQNHRRNHMAIRKLINFPGLKLSLETDKQAFVQNAAEQVGSRAYAATAAVTGKAWDDSAKTIEAGELTRGKIVKVVKAGTGEAGNLLSAAISEVADTSSRVAKATGDRALAAADEHIAQPVQSKIRSVQRRGQQLRLQAHARVDEYCGDTLEATIEPKALPQATQPKVKATIGGVIRQAVKANA